MLYLLDNNHKHIYFHTHWSQSNARLLLTALGPPCKRWSAWSRLVLFAFAIFMFSRTSSSFV